MNSTKEPSEAQEPAGAREPGTAPSRTGQAVALLRAGFDRPTTPDGDSTAQERLCAGMSPAPVPGMAPQLRARTRFFDDQVLDAIATGIRQVVICGAGYDDRALRFRSPGVAFFELDHPATQADKARRLAASGISTEGLTLAAANFRTDDVAAVLARAGQAANQPTLLICEGLLVYLEAQEIISLLGALSTRAAPGSVLAASLAVHAAGIDSARLIATANAGRRAGRSEPWRTILPAAEHLGVLNRAGWRVERVVDAADLAGDVDRDRSLLVTAAPDH